MWLLGIYETYNMCNLEKSRQPHAANTFDKY
jgi:hypothetical protein